MEKERYQSGLTDEERTVVGSLIPGSEKLGRPPRYSKCRVLDGVFYLVRSGIAWCMMPKDLPPGAFATTTSPNGREKGFGRASTTGCADSSATAGGKPRLLRSSTLKVCAGPADPAMMQERKLREAKDIYSWTRLDSCLPQWSTRRLSRTGTGLDWS